ncbi:MAG: glycosyl hydrolase [Bacteroidales bacterium]|jgi:hypothetical protein
MNYKTFLLFLLPAFIYLSPAKSQNILLDPGNGRCYHGVQYMDYENDNSLSGYLGALNDSTIQPAVRGFFMSIPGVRGPDNSLAGLQDFFHAAATIGFIPELSLFLVGQTATDSIIAATDQLDWIIDSVITISKGYGRRMFLRIGGEFNGAGEGWNGGGYHPYIFVSMFRKIVDRFEARGLRDSVAVNWCYEPDAPNDFDSVDAKGYRWYPGDEYVDWFGLDVFDAGHFDQSLPDSDRRGITRKGKSERFLAMARAKGKPVFMSETSAKGINISADNQDGMDDWNNWFAKFWQFIEIHPEIKGFAYINANWPAGAYPGWGDARIQNSQYVTSKYGEEMRKLKYVHLNQVHSTGIEAISSGLGDPFVVLYPNYPNPFQGTTVIRWDSNTGGHTRLDLFDSLGIRVKSLVDCRQPAGCHEVFFDSGKLSSGVYYYQIQIGPSRAAQPMIIRKN